MTGSGPSSIRGICDGLGYRDGSDVKRLFFEHSHRAVPDDGFGSIESVFEYFYRLNADVETDEAGISKCDRDRFS